MKIKFSNDHVIIERDNGGWLAMDVCEYAALYQEMKREDVKQCIVTHLEGCEDNNPYAVPVDEILADEELMNDMAEDILRGEESDRDGECMYRVLNSFVGIKDEHDEEEQEDEPIPVCPKCGWDMTDIGNDEQELCCPHCRYQYE